MANVREFIDKWKASGGAERANYQLFLSELCDVLEVPRPAPAVPDDAHNAYVFDRTVTIANGDGTTSTNYLDLYKRGCFVLEAKQGTERNEGESLSAAHEARRRTSKKGTALRGTGAWDNAMLRARGQAEGYARALPPEEGRPPFLVVVDIGHSFELFSEFSRTGGTYIPFPEPRTSRILLDQLADEATRQTLRLVWTDPLALDPTRRAARVTKEIADRLARLARSLEGSGHDPHTVAGFLMRALFTMFAEDVGLLPVHSFADLLASLRGSPDAFAPMVEELWDKMRAGGFSTALRQQVRRFNGGLFENATALTLTADQLQLLVEAAEADWRDVEPTIFGTLLERALDPAERHKLGAHYTPRAYVERLVLPTVVEPLREEWAAVQAAAVTLDRQGDRDRAVAEVQGFHRRLCEVRVLDPACGSGNFLYATLEHLKRLEGEVLEMLFALGQRQSSLELQGHTVDPHQLLGLEINPRAAAIAEMVLWIGYLQWHYRTRGNVSPPEPVLRNFRNIECRDAVLAWDSKEPVLDEEGNPVTRWDGTTTKTHPATGREVPDEDARIPVFRYLGARRTEWPEADFVVGNPPYLGARTIRLALGDPYLSALRSAYADVPEHADYVMYWWDKAASLTVEGRLRRFGLITTKGIAQTFSRKVVQKFLDASPTFGFRYAVANHPWVDTSDGAAVRVALTVCDNKGGLGLLQQVVSEEPAPDGEVLVSLLPKSGNISPDLRVGADILSSVPLRANAGLSSVGYQLSGKGFVLEQDQVRGVDPAHGTADAVTWPLLSGRDITQTPRNQYAIDCCSWEVDDLRRQKPEVFQWLLDHVKPERDQNNRDSVRLRWWVYGESRNTFRPALAGTERLVCTSITAKHRTFGFWPARTICDSTTVMFAFEDAFFLGVLSSRLHVVWALAAGGRLGVGNDPRYNKTLCYDHFPFPEGTNSQKDRVRTLALQLDSHRKRQLSLHQGLTLTGVYNVLEKLRLGESLSASERLVHEKGLVSVLRELHDELDTAVCAAYGWPADLSEEEVLFRLVALNKERAVEEANGLVRWLRPSYQNPAGLGGEQLIAALADQPASASKQASKKPWPSSLAEQARGVQEALRALGVPATHEDVAKTFHRAQKKQVAELLETLASLGQARRVDSSRYVAG